MQLQSIWILYAYSTNMGVFAPYCRRNAQIKLYVRGNKVIPILTGNMVSPIKGRKQVKVVREYGAKEHSWAWDREREREREKGSDWKNCILRSFMIWNLQQIVLGLPTKLDEIAWACRMHEEEDKHNLWWKNLGERYH